MRVSEHYGIGKTQASLEFVDVDISDDVPVFISPRAVLSVTTQWGHECVALIQDFFEHILMLINTGRNTEARALLAALGEPNETHLGLSTGKSRGHALGPGSAGNVWQELSESEAARTGLLTDLEDTVLLVPGISNDIVSDITTNIIRAPLIRFTQEIAEKYDIPLVDGVATGPKWDPRQKAWFEDFDRFPVTPSGRLLLVPRAIVRMNMAFDVNEYYRHYLLSHLQGVEIAANSGLVEILKNGNPRVTKKALQEKYGSGKQTIITQTRAHPAVLDRYKRDKEDKGRVPLGHEDLAAATGGSEPDWDTLLANVISCQSGAGDSTRYEKAVEALLTALLYPNLDFPKHQHEIHNGRKRIDITYANMAATGFFSWLSQHHPSSLVFVECKNYGGEVANPELDQLSGRFSPGRGKFGLLVCRSFDNKERFLDRCRDTAADDRGLIIALDDGDLRQLVADRKNDPQGFFRLRTFHDRVTALLS